MRKPNILVFMTDQQHAETIGEDGLCQTPHLNQLMKNGVTFSNAYTPCPMCTPARASAMTGLYPHQHKLVQNAHSLMTMRDCLHETDTTIGSALKEAGYRTAYAGKWHVGTSNPNEYGFDAVLNMQPGTKDVRVSDQVIVRDRYGEKILSGTADDSPENAYSFRVAKRVNDWLDKQDGNDKPFFLFASCHEPHVPWIVPEPYASMYDPSEIEVWDSYQDDLNDKPMTYKKHYFNIQFCRIQNNWPLMAKALSKYYGAVSMADNAFGTILKKLEEKKLMDNTIILFTSDHGEMMGRHGLIGKNELAVDDLIRIPLVAYWKGHFLQGNCDELISLTDLYNTIMDLAGAEPNDRVDSVSFAPALRGEAFNGREEVVIEHHGATIHMNTIRAIRTKEYKYVFRAHEIDEFYDLMRDPHEMTNRIADPAYREEIWNLRERLLEWARRHEDFAVQGLEQAFANPDQDELF
jgi:arylsulfatase A-like enzyme